jgi:hypothetical protein
MVRWNASAEHVKTQRLIDSVHLTWAPVLLGQRRPAVARSGPAWILRNRSQDFGIRDALCAGEGYNTELTTKADETKVKKDMFPAASFVVSFRDGMSRTPIASRRLFVGGRRDRNLA